MTRDEVIRLAREAGTEVQATSLLVPFLERFAALVAAQEREACAQLCNAEALSIAQQSLKWPLSTSAPQPS